MLNRMNDYYVKYLWGRESHKAMTLNFINGALAGTGMQFKDIKFVDKDQDPDFAGEKQSRLDIKGELNDGSLIEIEMQVLYYEHMAERSLYYWSRMYGAQLATSDDYGELQKTVAINLLDFDYLAEPGWTNRYEVLNVESKKALTEHLQIVFIELSKFVRQIKQEHKSVAEMNDLERWGAYLCRLVSDEEMEAIPMLATALEAEKGFTADEQLRWKYEQREKFLKDQASYAAQYKRWRERDAAMVKEALAKLKAAQAKVKEVQADAQAQVKAAQAKAEAEAAEAKAQVKAAQANAKAAQANAKAQIEAAQAKASASNELYATLIKQGRMEDMQRAVTDAEYRQRLMLELMPEKLV